MRRPDDNSAFGLGLGVVALLGASVAASAFAAARAPSAAGTPGAVEAPAHPTRIVSTNLPADEVLLALVSPRRIVALSHFADDPAISNVVREARAVPHRVAGMAEPILALHPDLVLAFPFGQGATQTLLRESGVAVVRVPGAEDLPAIRANVRRIARATGTEPRAERLIATMNTLVGAVRARVDGAPRPRVLFLYPGGFTSGSHTLIDALLTVAGGRNVAAEVHIDGVAPLPLERALELDPDVIFLLDYRADAKARDVGARSQLTDDPRWRTVTAVRRGEVHVLPSPHAYASSPYAALAAVDMARLLHPRRMAGYAPPPLEPDGAR